MKGIASEMKLTRKAYHNWTYTADRQQRKRMNKKEVEHRHMFILYYTIDTRVFWYTLKKYHVNYEVSWEDPSK